MRLFVMFDLPVQTSIERKNYRRFRKFLIENGYLMIQYSIYAKIILNHSALQLQKVKIQQHLPPKGHVETLLVTEKQFADMEHFSKPKIEKTETNSMKRVIEL
ncbi:CRISPR-associated endonuclease Cas2 [Lysinibacillus louembei]|uniref:CRISPR-associated endoribonuclease Cas2 n=1 Tax=Lysinibacillus louembei TaxID=1470088 RepID=A0ABZ0RWB9_9BACI|nr:CRISPR-associated endonuclease Cas2 [Lysinibacillus louembei]WPK11243.1 CRISPR-associated endonuclease Cas2 [Lysinibacillus louembei]